MLAGPFAAYQLAVLGADVIKVEDPNEPDQSRESGADMTLNKKRMGTGFLTQGSNKRSIALDLKTEDGRAALKRLVKDWADVFVENYRPGALKALGLGYDDIGISPGIYQAYRQSDALESSGIFAEASVNLTGDDAPPGRVAAASASRDLFTTLAVKPETGRIFDAREDRHAHLTDVPRQQRRRADRPAARHAGRVG